MIRLLSLNEDIEDIRKRLSVKVNAPVYIATAECFCGTLLGKKPGETNYEIISSIDLYLSKWDRGCCVNREDNNFYFDLTISDILHLVYPRKPKEKPEYYKKHSDIIKGLYFEATSNKVFIEKGDKVPEELKAFIHKIRYGHSRSFRDGISFVVSEPFYNPIVKREDWHLSNNMWIYNYKREFKPIQPPGYYSKELSIIDDFNHFGVVFEKEAGSCIVCRGKSGSLKHFCTFKGNSEYIATPINLVCGDCFIKMTEEIKKLLK